MNSTEGIEAGAALVTLAIEAKSTGNQQPLYDFLKTLDNSTLHEASICLSQTIAVMWNSLEDWQSVLHIFWIQGNK